MARRGAKLGTSVLDLEVDDSRFSSGLERNRRKAKSWTDSLNTDVKKGIGQGLGIAGGLGVAMAVSAGIEGVKAVVVGSIAAAMEWESAFAGVRKTVDASEAEFAELSDGIRQMSKEIPASTTELAGLAEAAGALGIAKDDILEFTRVTAMIGTTTDVSSDQAATSLGQLSNVLGLTAEDYERFGSTLVDLGNKGASTESQILGIASRAGAGSKLIGMASDQTLAWASSVANLGIEVEAGGTALQTFFLKSTKAVSEGTDKLETYARVAGMTGAEFKRAFEEDASGALEVFLAGLGQLSQGDQLKALEELGFSGERITRTLLGLAGNTDNLTDSLDVASEAWDANTALVAEAEKRYGTTEAKLQILDNRVNDLAITFGEELLPALVTIATAGVEALEHFAKDSGELVSAIGRDTQSFAGHFGEMGEAINALADEMDKDFGEVNASISRYMATTGATFEDALEAVRLYGTGNTVAAQEADRAWQIYQESITPRMGRVATDVAGGMEGVEGALLDGEGEIAAAAEVALTPIELAAKKARDAAVKAMADMLSRIRSLFESDESVREAMQGLLDRMDDPYTTAERKADIFSNDMIELIATALDTDDPGAVTATTEFVNRMLGEFALLEPGALESGTAVPPAIRDGMDAEVGALITWIEQNITHESLAAMEINAVPEGLEAIASYARGMEANKEKARRAAEVAVMAARAALKIDTYQMGRDFIGQFAAGIDSNSGTATEAVRRAAGGIVANLPFSEPKDPKSPFRGITRWNPLQTIYENMAGSRGEAAAATQAALAGVLDAVTPNLGPMVAPSVSGLGAAGASATGLSALRGDSHVTNQWILNVEGQKRTVETKREALDELERMSTTWG